MHKINLTADEVYKIVSGKLKADPNIKLSNFCEPDVAKSNSLCILKDKEAMRDFGLRTAGLLVIPETIEEFISAPCIVVESTSFALAKLLNKLFPPPVSKGTIHPRAIISESAKVGVNVEIGAGSYIGEDVDIGDNTIIYQNVVIGDRTKIGRDCRIYPSVAIYYGCDIGNFVVMHSGVVIGADGFGYASNEKEIMKINQVGNVVIEDHVEIGANSCIDRATIGTTRVGLGSKIDNQVQVGHNCKIGKFNIICGQVGIAGSVVIGDGVIIAGQVGIADHLKIGDRAVIGPSTDLAVNVKPGESIMGPRGFIAREYGKMLVVFEKLPQYAKRIRAIENEIFKKSQGLPKEKALDQQ